MRAKSVQLLISSIRYRHFLLIPGVIEKTQQNSASAENGWAFDKNSIKIFEGEEKVTTKIWHYSKIYTKKIKIIFKLPVP